jgi:hypothetical protein
MSKVFAVLALVTVAAATSAAAKPVVAKNDSGFMVPVPVNPQEAHPRIHAAINALSAAQAELKAAPHDFNGHRAAALKAIDGALAQLNLCMAVK